MLLLDPIITLRPALLCVITIFAFDTQVTGRLERQPNNFVIFRPKKDWLRLEVRLDRSEKLQARLDGSGLDVMDYDARWGRYRFRLAKGDATKHKEFLTTLMTKAYGNAA